MPKKDIMARKMLIDATHPEETRVVVVDGNKVEEFDFESINKRQIAGNIYLAKVTRVEPSLQAAFVDYGGNRHGFLAFAEIHPDYYQIPVADRERLLAEQAEAAADEDDEPEERKTVKKRRRGRKPRRGEGQDAAPAEAAPASAADAEAPALEAADEAPADAAVQPEPEAPEAAATEPAPEAPPAAPEAGDDAPTDEPPQRPMAETTGADRDARVSEDAAGEEDEGEDEPETEGRGDDTARGSEEGDEVEEVESLGADDFEEELAPRRAPLRRYKIQEVIKVRQILLVQVVKEERGNKGAALTTYLSLPGRYCVLMPNTARGGGISRKITNAADRKKLKEIATELEVPKGWGLIIRTAGSERTKAEIRRDYEYLLRQWDEIRTLTLRSIAPKLIYEEGSLIKRCIRDLYSSDTEEVLVEGEGGYREARDYMKMLIPAEARNVKLYAEAIPLFSRFQVESYLASMFNPVVQLKSGGYIVIGVTEALVAIDVNSGRATREHSIEETALKTNLEAAEEIARQLRLRDLAGLIVIDFIDMEERRNNASVEKRMKERLKSDRARIQIGRISAFGLMEMSRQRLRPGMLEATTAPCPHCHGTGLIRSGESLALTILREIEEEGVRQRSKEVLVSAPVAVANYLINQKRDAILRIETRYGLSVRVEADPALVSPEHRMERFKVASRVIGLGTVSAPITVDSFEPPEDLPEEAEVAEEAAEAAVAEPAAPAEGGAAAAAAEGPTGPRKRRRRRRRRGGGQGEGRAAEGTNVLAADASDEGEDDEDDSETPMVTEAAEAAPAAEPAQDAPEMASVPAPEMPADPAPETVESPAAAEPAPVTGATLAPAAEEPAAVAAEPAEPAKPRRVRRPRAERSGPSDALAVLDPATGTAAGPEIIDVPEAAAPPPPKKPRTRRRPAAETAAAAEPAAPAAAEAAPAPEPESVAEPAPVAEAAPAPLAPPEPVAAAPTAVAEATPAEAAPAEAAAPGPAEPPKPKRRGWWSFGG